MLKKEIITLVGMYICLFMFFYFTLLYYFLLTVNISYVLYVKYFQYNIPKLKLKDMIFILFVVNILYTLSILIR